MANSELMIGSLYAYEITYEKMIEIRDCIPQGFHVEIYLDNQDDSISFSSMLTSNSHTKEPGRVGAIASNSSDAFVDNLVEEIHREIEAVQRDRVGL